MGWRIGEILRYDGMYVCACVLGESMHHVGRYAYRSIHYCAVVT